MIAQTKAAPLDLLSAIDRLNAADPEAMQVLVAALQDPKPGPDTDHARNTLAWRYVGEMDAICDTIAWRMRVAVENERLARNLRQWG